MGGPGDNQNNLTAYHSGPLEDLTIQDALIISAVYAVEADTEKCKRISTMAQKHPLFEEQPEATSARVNKFVNWMQATQSPQAVEAIARDLKPEHRQEAFEFATEAALMDNRPTDKKKKILQTLAAKLELPDEFVGRKLSKFQN